MERLTLLEIEALEGFGTDPDSAYAQAAEFGISGRDRVWALEELDPHEIQNFAWRLCDHDSGEHAHILELAAAYDSDVPPPPVLVVHHPDGHSLALGATVTGLDGFRRVTAAVHRGLPRIRAWVARVESDLG